MKKKSIFLFLSMFVLGVCTTLGFFQPKENKVYAESISASVWDKSDTSAVTETDFYTDTVGGVRMHHILTAKGFAHFASLVNGGSSYFIDEVVKLECDINLNKQEWTPIGLDDLHTFKGTFQGNGHYIYNMSIGSKTSYSTRKYVGLFGTTATSISDLHLKDIEIYSKDANAVGGIAGLLSGTTHNNLSVSGTITTNGAMNVGGVIGDCGTSGLRRVSNIMSEVVVKTTNGGTSSTVGGVFGKYAVGNGHIQEVAFKGSIEATANYVGGLLGQVDNFGDIKNSYSVASITNSGLYTAGLIANVNSTSSSSRLTNLYNAGVVKTTNTDGFCAGLFGTIARAGAKTVENCLNLSNASSGNYSPLYNNDKNTSESNFSHIWFNVDSYSPNAKAVRGLSKMATNKSLYENEVYFSQNENVKWNFDTVWSISSGINNSLPYLINTQNLGNANNDKDYSNPNNVLSGNGTIESPYLIKTAADLGYLSANYTIYDNKGNAIVNPNLKGKYFSLQNDIDLTGKNWQPIGYSEGTAFSGVFDGNNHTIYGMTCSLQQQYSYHGLFGVTLDAVIKNLRIKDIRFINVTDNVEKAGCVGSIVAYAKKNTYLVNCLDESNVDESMLSDLKTVGKVDEDCLTVAFGKNNLINGGTFADSNCGLKLAGTSYKKAFDVEVYGNGGTFYDLVGDEENGKTVEVVLGTYRLMVSSDGMVENVVGNIDKSFKAKLPTLSEKYGYTATLIKRGYKLEKFVLVSNETVTAAKYQKKDSEEESDFELSISSNISSLINGIKAVYQKQNTKNLVVVYNQYEIDNFVNAIDKPFANRIESQTYNVEYDSILWEDYQEIFNKQPVIAGKKLREGLFNIEGFYFAKEVGGETILFGTEVNSSAFANDTNLPIKNAENKAEIYVKWNGSTEESANKQLRVVLARTQDDPILANFDLANAIESVSLSAYANSNGYGQIYENIKSVENGFNFVEENGNVVVAFDFNTANSDFADNGLVLKVKLKGGYEFAEDVVLNDFSSEHDFDFGHLVYGDANVLSNAKPTANIRETDFRNGLKFKNLDEDYTIEVSVKRQTYSTNLDISSNEVYFALAPSISNVRKVKIFGKDFNSNPNTATTTDMLVDGVYVGLDVFNKQFVSSAENIGTSGDPDGHAFNIDLSAHTDIWVGLVYDDESGIEQTKFFKYEMGTFQDTENNANYITYTLYEMSYETEWKKIDILATIYILTDVDGAKVENRKISYLMNSQFTLIGSVKDDISDTIISKWNENFVSFGEQDIVKNVDATVLNQSASGTKKLRYDISIEIIGKRVQDDKAFESQIGVVENIVNGEVVSYSSENEIRMVSQYTKVSFDVQFVEFVGEGDDAKVVEILSNKEPSLVMPKGTSYEIPSSGKEEVFFKFTASDYYRFSEQVSGGNFGIVFQNGELTYKNENLLVEAETVNVESLKKVDETDFDEDAKENDWIQDFNTYNGHYLSSSVVIKTMATKYSMDENAKLAHDNYEFSLFFGEGDNIIKKLLPGKYIIKFVCTPVKYSLNYSTKFVEYDKDENYIKDENGNFTTDKLKDEIDGEVLSSPTVSVNFGGVSGVFNEEQKLYQVNGLYDGHVEASTALGENKAYQFYDWLVEGELWSGFLMELNREDGKHLDFEFDFKNVYYGYPQSVTLEEGGIRDYNLTLTAVYIKKEVNISLNNRVSVEGNDVFVTANSLGITMGYAGTTKFVYSNQNALAGGEDINVSFVKSGTSGASYFISGFNILDAQNHIIERVVPSNTIYQDAFNGDGVFLGSCSIKTFMVDRLQTEALDISTSYTIVPILTRKTAQLSIVSGTGAGLNGNYTDFTDGKNGDVYYLLDGEKVSTTDTVVTVGQVNVGDTLYLNFENEVSIDGTLQTVVIDDLFAQRTGYFRPSNAYWNWSNGEASGQLNGSQLYIASTYFDGTSEFVTSINLVVYRTWTANSYTITFGRNEGLFEGANTSDESVGITVRYDHKVENALTVDDISKVGYTLAGWTNLLNQADAMVFDEEGNWQAVVSIFDAEGNFIATNDINVYALWTPKTYKVQLVTNGANIVAGEEATSTIDFDILYGTTFAEAFDKLGLSGGDNAPTREGFIFNEIYVNGLYRQKVTGETYFTENLPGCVLKDGDSPSATLYIDWIFDTSYLNLKFNSLTVSKTYTASNLTFFISEYFKNGFEAKGYVVEIVDDQTVSISVSENLHARVKCEIVSSMVEVSTNSSFIARDANLYNISLVLTVEDMIYDGTVLYTETINLYAQIDKANISISIDSENEDVWLGNVKRIMQKFVSESTFTRLDSCKTFSAFVTNVLKSLDETVPVTVTNKEAYEFVMYKYYNMISSTDYTLYKNLTYADFVEMKAENPTNVQNVVERVVFFDFFNHNDNTSKVITMYDNNLTYSSDTVLNPRDEISVSRVEIVADEINAETYYYFRAIIENVDENSFINNYRFSFDENGQAYISLGSIYILPELLELESMALSNSAYYNANLLNVEIAWQGNRATLNEEGFENYFKIEENLYVKANLYTSNLGKELDDTDFSFTHETDYLYYTNVSIYRLSTTEDGITNFDDVTNQFKLILPKDYLFTILNIDGVVKFEVSAKYLTFLDGFMEFVDLPTNVSQNLLKITQVTYDINDGLGIKRVSDTTNGLEERAYDDNGNLICQIERNNKNNVSIILSKFVKTVSVIATEKSVSDYISLHKWTEDKIYNIDGTMESNTSFTFDRTDLEGEEGSVATASMYAVYTDMVLVSYNLNFPSNFTPSTPSTSWLKLGESTIDDLLLPKESGFELASLIATRTKESYETIFDSADGKFKGIVANDKHAKVELEAKWKIEDIIYNQTLTEYKTGVYGFDYLSVPSVVEIQNKNEALFNYSYEWYKGDKLISKTDRFTLEGNGTVEESGTYRLVVTANVKKEFLTTALVSSEGATNSFEVSFEMEFIKNKLVSITFVGAEEIDYNAGDHINEWYAMIEYAVYNPDTGEYNEHTNVVIEYFTGAKNVDFVIERNGSQTTTMKDAGTYIISAKGREDVYSNASEIPAVTFELTINPYVVELSDYDINFSKNFNAQEPKLSRDIYLANENVTINFTRPAGQEVGSYDLFISSISEDKKENYLLKMNGVVIFENGRLTEVGKTTSVGTFEILTSGTLSLYYEVSDTLLETLEVGYSADGYRAELDGFTLKIYNGSNLLYSLQLSLYDESLKETVSNSTILQIIFDNFSNVKINFFDTMLHESVVSSGTYTYMFTGLDEISKYFSNVAFVQGYQFVVGKIEIDISTLPLDKVYNGLSVDYFTPEGEKIDDINSFSGVYIAATYQSPYVGTTKVELSLHDTNEGQEVSNYQLSDGSKLATIRKLSAKMTINMDKPNYEYGELSLGNLDSHVSKDYLITDAEGNNITSLLANGRFNINYSLSSAAPTNDNGFIYKGTYQLQAEASFDDFNMALELPKIQIISKTIEKGISDGQISVLASDSIAESYAESFTISETGDTFDILYSVVGVSVGSSAAVGFYELRLAFSEYLTNGSVTISIESGNSGFEVKTEDKLVYIVLDEPQLNGVYNGYAYNLSTNLATQKLIIENNGAETFVDFRLVYAKDDSAATDVVLNELDIFSGVNTKSFAEAGSFKLNFKAGSSSHSNFAFKQDYYLNIAKREIDASKLNLERKFTGSPTFIIDDFDEKIGDDGVSLVARFESVNVGDDIPVTLFLQGAKTHNYVLFNAEGLKGKIVKADAQVELAKTEYVYGNLTTRDMPAFKVLCDGLMVSPSQYNVILNVEGARYSTLGYLEADTYNIVLDESSSSTNYNLEFVNGNTITVSPLEISVVLTTSGQYSYIYGASETTTDIFEGTYMTPLNEMLTLRFTRTAGQEVGYYKVLDAVSTSNNYQILKPIEDRSEGAFRILKAQDIIYILMSNSETVSGDDKEISSITYDGNLYDTVSVSQKAGSKGYQLIFESTSNASAKQFYDLGYYTYDSENNIYTRQSDLIVDGLKANIAFANGVGGKNVGEYLLNVLSASADNFSVVLGKYGLQSFYLNIEKRDVYFLQEEVTKEFDNDFAEIIYQNPTEMLDGLLQEDLLTLSLTVRLTQDGKLVKYVGDSYDVEASLIGGKTNYRLHLCTKEGASLIGKITPAPLTISVRDQTFVYGEEIRIEYDYSAEIDLNRYEKGVSISVEPVADPIDDYSTSGCIKVGTYSLHCLLGTPDFRPVYVSNGEPTAELVSTVTIIQKQLTLEAINETLEAIFTKTYDGTNEVKLVDESGNERLRLLGVVERDREVSDELGGTTTIHAVDKVTLAAATYATEFIGQSIKVEFTLGGDEEDFKNYLLSAYEYGVIKAVVVGLNFNYNADGSNVKSNVEALNLPQISALAFPFMSDAYLTANSANANTASVRNFPTNLTGKTGFVFKKWTMSFKSVVDGSQQYIYLTSVLTKLGLNYVYESEEFKIDVSNNSETVDFLKTLLNNEADLFGTYYKNNENISFTFDANWEINTFQVSIKIADETGADASYGKVLLQTSSGVSEEIISNYTGRFDYGTRLTLLAQANEHCSYYGFYNANGSIHYDNGTSSGVTVSTEPNGVLLTVGNLANAYNFVARFEADKVNVVVDLSDASDATISSEKFVAGANNKYTWRATYLELQNFTLAQIGLQMDGFTLTSINDGKTNITDFENTHLSDLISEKQTTLTLTPNFLAVGVVVTLDFADGVTSNKNITVPFKQSYGSSEGWNSLVENPIREGYSFVGWYNAAGDLITKDTILSTTENHTLTARWSIMSYTIKLKAENVKISSTTVSFDENSGVYTLSDVDFNSQISFTVEANVGYELKDYQAWNSLFVTSENNGVVMVSFKMPHCENGVFECTIFATALTHTVTVLGDNLGEILAYDISAGEQELSVVDGVLKIETGKTLKLVVSAEYGYQMIETFECLDVDVRIENSIENDVLTLIISNILRDLTISLNTLEVINDITIKFSNPDIIESLVVDGLNYNDFANLLPFRIVTGETLEMYIKYKHGFEYDTFDTAGDFAVVGSLATEGLYGEEGYYKIVISNIEKDGQILLTSKRSRFTLNVEVLSYNEKKQLVNEPGNKAIIRENSATSIEVDFESEIHISYEMLSTYNFAGWSKDGVNVFSMDENLAYKVENNETIYAIFSSMKFTITFATYNHYTLYSEYQNPDKEKPIYQEIIACGEKYLDGDSGEELKKYVLYYGANKTIRYVVPNGYRFYGFGYYDGKELVMLDIDTTDEREVDFTISSLELNEDVTEFVLYVIVNAYSFDININSFVDIDGEREENIDVGNVVLQGSNGQSVNQYGFVDGTRTRYSAEDFANGTVVDDRAFKIVSFTGENVYIKVNTVKQGYKFYDVVSNAKFGTITEIQKTDTYAIYLLSGIIGGTSINVDVLFRPKLNDIKVGFKLEGVDTDGGAITFVTDANNKRKVFASGKDYSSITLSAYTDSRFEVVAYVRNGFYIDPNDIQISCANDIIDRTTIVYQQLSIEKDGYTGVLRFMVRDYLNQNEIFVSLKSSKYTVKFVDNGETLAIVKNVEFGSRLNLYESNQANIQILDAEERLQFVDGKLEFLMQKQNYHFEGLFTSENGAGVMYIDTNGIVLQEWKESGYALNSLTSKYELTENAHLNAVTGEMEITLYVYWSYYKTRIKFDLVPNTNVDVSAQDMISGVDYTNSWFYPTSKFYIEVAFNTNIYITAPKIDGYKFYKFVIKQRGINGNALEDVVTFSEEVPWSTNELDSIVECNVQIVYFAQVETVVFGGEGDFILEQETSDAQARALVEQKYVDTTKPFKVVANFNENDFEFVRWNNITNGQSWWSKEWDGLRVDTKTTLILNLQGKTFTMSFADEKGKMYDYTFGQIFNVIITSTDNSVKVYRLGAYSVNGFVPTLDQIDVRVGDRVTFVVSTDYGFTPVWNVDEIVLASFADGASYYDLTITNCPDGEILRVLPHFKNEIISIYINRDFVDTDKTPNAIDLNSVTLAGYATFGGKRTDQISVSTETDGINIGLVTNDRYEIASMVFRNYDKVFTNVELFTDSEGNILLSKTFIESNDIVGAIQIEIRYRRALWENHQTTVKNFKGSGTDDDPYQIFTVEDLVLMMQLCNSGVVSSGGVQFRSASYILMDNLTISEKFWTPIGTIEYSFNGYFNFNGYTVSQIFNAYIYEAVSYDGLFGVLSPNAVILKDKTNIWYVYLIAGVGGLVLIVVVVLIIVAKKRKKRREMMANK